MTSPRQAHAGKSPAEKDVYARTVVQRREDPTIGSLPTNVESTEIAVTSELSGPLVPTHKELVPPRSKWFREHSTELAIAAVSVILAPFGGCIYVLNREVGEVKKDLESMKKMEERDRGDVEKAEQRLRSEIERSQERQSLSTPPASPEQRHTPPPPSRTP